MLIVSNHKEGSTIVDNLFRSLRDSLYQVSLWIARSAHFKVLAYTVTAGHAHAEVAVRHIRRRLLGLGRRLDAMMLLR
jgi:hypothetical protein